MSEFIAVGMLESGMLRGIKKDGGSIVDIGNGHKCEEKFKKILTKETICSFELKNCDFSFVRNENEKRDLRVSELKMKLWYDWIKGRNFLSGVVLEGLIRELISVDEALLFVDNNWKRMRGFKCTRWGTEKGKKKDIKRDRLNWICKQKLGYLGLMMLNDNCWIERIEGK